MGQMIAYSRLITKQNVKLLALKVVMVAYDRWPLTRSSKYLTWKLWYFGKPFAGERWLLTRGGRNQRFICIITAFELLQIFTSVSTEVAQWKHKEICCI